MTTFRYRRTIAGALLAFFLSLSTASAATPRDELLRLVPDDVGFCLVVQDLRTHSAAFLASPFVKRFQDSPLGQVIRGAPEIQRLEALEKYLQKQLGLDWATLRDDILGDAVVYAYRPGPPDKPEEEQGLILVRARNAKLLSDLFERFKQTEKDAGDAKKLEVREHQGLKYYRRVESKGANYFYLRDAVLVITAQEPILRQAVELDKKASLDKEPPLARQLRLLGADKPLATLWINPGAFQGNIERRAAEAQGAEAAILKAFSTYWKALEGVALSLDLQKDIELSLAVRAKMDQLPDAARRFLAEAAKPSELWDRFPDDALLAIAGRVDAGALFELLGDFLTKEDREALRDSLDRTLGAALGKDWIKQGLPYVGPDLGLCVTAPPATDKAWFPHTVLALRVQPGPKDAPVDQAVLKAVNTYALLGVLGYNRRNKDQMAIRSTMVDKIEVKYLVNDQLFPPGLQPAYALQKGYLVLASSPEAIRCFGALSASNRVKSDAAEVPLLRVSLKDLRQFVKDRREPLAALVAERNQISKKEAGQALDKLVVGLELFDRLELSHRSVAGQVTLTLRVRTAEPLK